MAGFQVLMHGRFWVFTEARTGLLARRAGVAADVVFIGGVARNASFRDVLLERLGLTVHVPPDPQMVAAIGCALLAREAEYCRMQEGESSTT